MGWTQEPHFFAFAFAFAGCPVYSASLLQVAIGLPALHSLSAPLTSYCISRGVDLAAKPPECRSPLPLHRSMLR
eukprot:6075040-Amphidinium_carterae.1